MRTPPPTAAVARTAAFAVIALSARPTPAAPVLVDHRLQVQAVYGLAVGASAEYMAILDQPFRGGPKEYWPTLGVYTFAMRRSRPRRSGPASI